MSVTSGRAMYERIWDGLSVSTFSQTANIGVDPLCFFTEQEVSVECLGLVWANTGKQYWRCGVNRETICGV